MLESQVYDIVFVTETWLNDSFSDALLCNNTVYSVLRHDRQRQGGGVCIFVKESISVAPITFPPACANLELVGVDIFLANLRYRLLCCYRSPSVSIADQREYIATFSRCLPEICSVSFPVILTGDFNFASINWLFLLSPKDGIQDVFLDVVAQCGLRQLVTSSTREQNILDLVFSTERRFVSCISTVPGFSTSDHNAVDFSLLGYCKPTLKSVSFHNFRKANYAAINSYLVSVDWVNTFSVCGNVEQFWNAFSAVLQTAIELYVPVCRSSTSKRTYPAHINRLRNKKCVAWRKRFLPGGFALYRECATKYKCAVERHVTNRKRGVLLSGNLSNFYSYVNSKITVRKSIGPLKRADNSVALSDSEKADILNHYFASVFTNNVDNKPEFKRRTANVLSVVTFHDDQVLKTLCNLKCSYACGPDGLSSAFFSRIAFSVAKPLASIFEVSFRSGCLPSVWLLGNVCPILKKGDVRDPANYRPVSLTCVACKVMETIVRENMLRFLRDNKLLSNAQFGFMSKRSTCLQLIDCINNWSCVLDERMCVDVAYLDFSKAFDKVSHEKLILKLSAYGFSGCLLQWISAFLKNREQKVNVNHCFSEYEPVSSGVPQGSVLGPLLFLIYINDICDIIQGVQFRLFADDVKVFVAFSKIRPVTTLQNCLNAICEWSVLWQLPIATDKCSILHIGFENPRMVYYLGGVPLINVPCMRDLGVVVSDTLNFRAHLNDIIAKAYRRLNLMFRVFSIHDPSVFVRAYSTYVRPLLEYCSAVWSPYFVQDITNIERVQKYFTRRLFRMCNFSEKEYTERLHDLGLESLEVRRLRADLVLCFQIVRGFVDFPSDSLFTLSHVHSTRGHPYKLVVNYSRTKTRHNMFANRVAKIWNSLPCSAVCSNTISTFKAQISNVSFSNFVLFP